MFNIYTDGGSRGNPGISACAYIIKNESNEIIDMNAIFLGINTNNFAEYNGLLFALKSLKLKKVGAIKLHLDSELVVKQIKGEYKIKNEILLALKEEVDKYLKKYKYEIVHIKRADNHLADRLVNIALDCSNN